MPAQLALGEDQITVHYDLEDPTRRRNQVDRCVSVGPANLGRQPGGLRSIPSDVAEFDRHVHGFLLVGG